ncbi:UDP-glucose/GDP-mannose dehydrogenase family protein [Spirillospora sp. NPDC029432]|uniref:UDP-glucose dehydrogenase family protein n=1 Tax=Spirillospora sp. NPDC029432 TaxID=3154599 RepID=UPI00345120E2
MDSTGMPRLTVLGTGYLGATHAICAAALGADVMGVDVDERRIARLAAGELPFFEPGLPELLAKALDSGRLRFTTSYAEAGAFGDVHFLCVGTPQRPGSDACDLSYVDAAVRSLAPTLERRALVVGKSTVPVGTAARLARLLRELAPAGADVELAWNPEFLREGHAVDDTMRPDRLVFGVGSDWAEERLRAAFRPLLEQGTPVITTDPATAELAKVAANAYLATKISFINAMAEVCEAAGADVAALAAALAPDERIGGACLRPGLGFGGGCLPKDIRAFAHRAEEIGAGRAVAFLREVDAINRRRRARTVDLVRELLDGRICGARIAAWGAAFKPNSDDVRDAPALDVARTLHGLGAHVRVFDPAALDNARRAFPELRYGRSALDAARGADVVVLLTEWADFRAVEPDALAGVVAHRRIVDGRHALDAARWRAAGWEYRALGRA